MFRFRPSDRIARAVAVRGAQPHDVGSLLSIQPRLVDGASRLGARFLAGVLAVCRGGLLVFLSIALALSQDAAFAQSPLTNGANHTGVIQVGGLDTWTIQAAFNDSITVSIGEVTGSGPDPVFLPRIRLRGPDGASLGDAFGDNAAEIAVRAPLTGTYTVLVSSCSTCFGQQVGPGSYVLTVAKTPGPYSISSGDEGGPITNGAIHAGVVQVGDLDAWTIQASFNDSITVSIGEVTGSGPDPVFLPRIRLLGPDGASLGDAFGDNAAEISVRAPLTGTYTVLVSSCSTCFGHQIGPGSYSLTVAKTPGPYTVSFGDEGGPITNGATHAGVIQVGDLDVWTIQASFNDSITVSIGEVAGSGPDPVFLPRIRLLGPNGASSGDAFGDNAAEISVRAPLTGIYTVLVSSCSTCFGHQIGPGSYVLTVAKTPGPYSVSSGDEGGAITNGANHAGVIQVGDLDVWTIQASFNDSITVSIGEGTANGPDPVFLPRIRLLGPDGASLGDAFGDNAAEIDVRAPLTGTYTVLVSSCSTCFGHQVDSGSYVLTLVKRPGPYTVSSGDEGGPITNSVKHAGVIQVGDLDPWTFQANFNDNITISIGEGTVNGPDPVFLPRIRLRGPDGASLGDAFGDNAAEIDTRAPSAGTYTVLVSSCSVCFGHQTGPGSYSLTVSGLTAPVSPPSVNAFAANPSTIAAGQSSTLSWTTTNATTVSISGVSGAQLTIGSVSVSPIVTTNYTLTATGPGGTATATTTIVTLTTAPSVSGVNPTSGSTAGGTQVTVSGTNFTPGASVSFGGTGATSVSVTSATTITCNTPPHSAGAVTVQVVNPGDQSGQLSNAFTYTAPVSQPPGRHRAVGH